MKYKPYQEIHAYRGKMKEQELQMHTGKKKNTSKHSSTLAAHSSSNTVYSKNTNIYITHGNLNSGKTQDRQGGCYSKGLSLITGLAAWTSCALGLSAVPCVRQVHLHATPLAKAAAVGGKAAKR